MKSTTNNDLNIKSGHKLKYDFFPVLLKKMKQWSKAVCGNNQAGSKNGARSPSVVATLDVSQLTCLMQ